MNSALTSLNELLNRLEVSRNYWRDEYYREASIKAEELEKAKHEAAAYKKAWEEAIYLNNRAYFLTFFGFLTSGVAVFLLFLGANG